MDAASCGCLKEKNMKFSCDPKKNDNTVRTVIMHIHLLSYINCKHYNNNNTNLRTLLILIGIEINI